MLFKMKKSTIVNYFIFLIVTTSIIVVSIANWQRTWFLPRVYLTDNFFINTPGCVKPALPIWNDDIQKFSKRAENFDCGIPLITGGSDEGGHKLKLNIKKPQQLLKEYSVSNIEDVWCNYTEIIRFMDFDNVTTPQIIFRLKDLPLTLNENIEFIRVNCFHKNVKIYDDYLFFAIKKKKRFKHKESNTNNITADRISVMILGIDALSHVNFLRQMPNVRDFIKVMLPHIEYFGFNKVGANTYPNLMALLSGFDANKLNKEYHVNESFTSLPFDDVPLIWQQFQKAGYITAFGEDIHRFGLFRDYDFDEQPTDYFLPALIRFMWKQTRNHKERNMYLCLGKRMAVDVLMDFVYKLLPFMKNDLFFSFLWSNTLSHDYLNKPQLLDEPMLGLLKTFQHYQIFNNTVIFFMSDHGQRVDTFRSSLQQGRIEDCEPLLITLLPHWFELKYPAAVQQMRINARRLITHYDIHDTMLDLMNLRNIENDAIAQRTEHLNQQANLPRGISLFLPVPDYRTCQMANIAVHYCTCYQRQPIAANNQRVLQATHFVLNEINSILEPYTDYCSTLLLKSIIHANKISNGNIISSELDLEELDGIWLQLQTIPGDAIFEATILVNRINRLHLSGQISRINLYSNQSQCINEEIIKRYCFCLNNTFSNETENML